MGSFSILDLAQATLVVVGAALFIRRRSLRYLSALQQDEYAPDRFWAWYAKRAAYDKRGTFWSIIIFAAGAAAFGQGDVLSTLLAIAAFMGYLVLALLEPDPRTSGKIKLVLTKRAKQILLTHFSILVIIFVAVACASLYIPEGFAVYYTALFLIFVIQFIPVSLTLSVKALQPLEEYVQQRYFKQASATVRQSGAYVIGITGSYGKTSTKNALGEILQITRGATFWPRKGINTLMGNTREIRSSLSKHHQYAVIEMAAYRRGSIAKLCELAPPKAGIITAIGIMHLERFGSAEEIYRAKTELARAIPEDGILVCNGDDPGARRAAEEFPKKTTIIYGFDSERGHLDCRMFDIASTIKGSTFKIQWRGREFSGSTGLLGKPALSNLMAVFGMACALGSDPNYVLAAFRNLKPVDNRLSIEKAGEVVRLKDAYNSNPSGFEAALDILRELPASNRLLITPGMIELGDRQYEENSRLARISATICDKVIFVGSTNRAAFESGLREGGFDMNNAVFVSNRDTGLEKLREMESPGDVTLIENDLGDWYEDRSKF
ncbi:MAG: UDP-N-acetylmuramoyl-tripeptide--D-alanyl-D-alanine ligase [Deltaproteobacteria bacterium]|nr:UDP-N-acetylmuramoyl-tripeptide--D-alanyl-D-alanine ligase [Deltaproteobacteria bacterium]